MEEQRQSGAIAAAGAGKREALPPAVAPAIGPIAKLSTLLSIAVVHGGLSLLPVGYGVTPRIR